MDWMFIDTNLLKTIGFGSARGRKTFGNEVHFVFFVFFSFLFLTERAITAW